MDKIVYFLEELASLDMDDDGDIVMFNEFNWAERIREALERSRKIKQYMEVSRRMNSMLHQAILEQVGLDENI